VTETSSQQDPAPHRGTVVLGVTGSIAAYKAAELIRLLMARGWDVYPVMTPAGARFITPLTLQTLARRPVTVDLFAEEEDWRPTHIHLADLADVLVVAPASANAIARLAHGLADDALTAIALATRAPLVIAPAMNVKMWEHAATQANVALLAARGARIVGPAAGDLACGYEGRGRLAALDEIVAAVEAAAG